MKEKVKLGIGIFVLVVILTGAYFGYRYLTRNVTEKNIEVAKSQGIDFTIQDKEGKEVTLSHLKGKPVILNFWTTWCVYCIAEMPDFEEEYQNHRDEVYFMMINVGETKEEVEKFVEQKGYTFPIYYDVNMEVANKYNITGFPQTIVIDENGNIVKRVRGMLQEGALRKIIDSLVGE